MKVSLDQLRKMGEHGELSDVYCLDGYIGFHHSWLGDEKFIKDKIDSYAHIVEHKGMSNTEYIRECLSKNKSIFPGHVIELDNDVVLMDTVKKLRQEKEYQKYFL